MKVFIVTRKYDLDENECDEQTIIAIDEERALKLASKTYGEWKIEKAIDLKKEQVLTRSFRAG